MTIFSTTQTRKKYPRSVWGWQNSSGLFNVWRATKLWFGGCFFFPTSPQPCLFLSCSSLLHKKPTKQVLKDEGSTWSQFLHDDGHSLSFPLSCPSPLVGKNVHDPESIRHVPERDFPNPCWRAGAVLDRWRLFVAARTSAVLGPRSGSGWNGRRRRQQRAAAPTQDAVTARGRARWLCL